MGLHKNHVEPPEGASRIQDGRDFGVELTDISKYYGKTPVLNGISLAVRRGEFLSILGPSGCGKTTLLRIIGGFTPPTSGTVRICGEPADDRAPYERDTSMVFQHLALFPHMTVFDNVAYGLKVRRVPKAEIAERVSRALQLVKLEGLEDRRPKQLSGGQQQRVALARSLIIEPSVVLLDEPLGSLDLKLRQEMEIEVKKLHALLGITFVYVTHDQNEALTMSDRVAVMHDGRLEQIGTAEDIYERPETEFVADFIGETNIFKGEVLAADKEKAALQVGELTIVAKPSDRLSPGRPGAVSVRPQHVELSPDGLSLENSFSGLVEEKLYRGASYRYLVRLEGGQALMAEVSGPAAGLFNAGDSVTAGWPAVDSYPLASPDIAGNPEAKASHEQD